MTAPLCRCCARPIAKRVDWKILTADAASMAYNRECKMLVEALPQTKAEAQALFNEQVIAVKRAKLGIDQVSLWDGQTYVDELFCTLKCAARFGRMAALHNAIETKAYAAAKRSKEIA